MKPITTKVEKIEDGYFLRIPNAVVETMGWEEGMELLVPFLDIRQPLNFKKEESGEFKEEVLTKIRGVPKLVKRREVIELLEGPDAEDLSNFRTAYIEWKGGKYGSKAIMKHILGHGDFNTVEAEWYLGQLGFTAKRINAFF